MYRLNLLLIVVLVTSCSESGVTDNANTNTMILVASIIIGVLILGKISKKDQQLKAYQTQTENSYFESFKADLEKEGIMSSNKVTSGTVYGIAISDDLQKLAVYSENKKLSVFDKEKIVSTECKTNNKQTVNSKSKTPVVSWNTMANTKGEITNEFESSDLLITLNDITTPLLRFRFFDQERAEKYNALINLMIKNKS